jgi:hypothetical protein
MTDAEIIRLAVADPLVIAKHSTTGPNGVVIPIAQPELQSIAVSELQNELNSLLANPVISRALLEGDHSLTLSSGTTITQGLKFTLPRVIGTVVSVTTGTTKRPLKKWRTREDFESWYYRSSPETTTTEDSVGWLVWDRSTQGEIIMLISPGIGDDTTANIHYVKNLGQPISLSIFPDNMHFLVSTGLKNRLTGGAFDYSYNTDFKRVIRRIEPMIGGASPIPLSSEDEEFNCAQSRLVAGPLSSDSPLFVSARQ